MTIRPQRYAVIVVLSKPRPGDDRVIRLLPRK